jgi:hypothetical protein
MKKENKIKVNKNQESAIINEKNEQLVKVKPFSISKFIIKLFAAAILITFAVLIFINKEEAQFAVLLITGSVCAIAALIRVVPLLRTLKTPQAKMVSFCEIMLHLAVGGLLIIAAFTYLNNPEGAFGLFVNENFHLVVAIILYTRAVAYFWITVLYKERTTKFNFWLHIIVITLAVVFAALRELSAYHIAIALAVISLIAALYLVIETGGGYWRYRKSIANAKKKEEEHYHKEDGIQAPSHDQNKIINEIDPSIIPTDEPTIDSTIVS